MAMIGLSSGFSVIPEGIHKFKIVDVKYKEDFGKLDISMVTSEGLKYRKNYTLMTSKGEPNQGSLNAFSYFAKSVVGNFDLEEIDPDDLNGICFIAEVVHDERESNTRPGVMNTFVNLNNIEPCDDWEEDAPKEKKKTFDLNSIL